MTKKNQEILTGVIITENEIVSFVEICDMTYSSPDLIKEMVAQGLIDPIGNEPDSWRFSMKQVMRLQTVRRLQRDFDLSLPGAGLTLDLLDEVKELRVKVAELEKLLLGAEKCR